MSARRRLGRPSRWPIAVAAVGSVGETIAPSTKAPAQLSPSVSCATTAIATIVVRTSPTASSPIGFTLARNSRNDEKKARP